jgi:hypothetical protein
MRGLQRHSRWMGALTNEASVKIMNSKTKIRPVNSLVFVSDPDGGSAPVPMRGKMILSTPSCISVRCYPEQDGPTEIILGKARDVTPGQQPAFEGELETPSCSVVVSTAERETVLEAVVSKTRTLVRIWLSDPRWPDRVIIGWE